MKRSLEILNQPLFPSPSCRDVMTFTPLLAHILQDVSVHRICELSTVCQAWKMILNHDNFWADRCISAHIPPESGIPLKQLYIAHFSLQLPLFLRSNALKVSQKIHPKISTKPQSHLVNSIYLREKTLLVGSTDGFMVFKKNKLQTWQKTYTYKVSEDWVIATKQSKGYIACGLHRGIVHICSQYATVLATLTFPEKLRSFYFDDETLITGGTDGTVRFWTHKNSNKWKMVDTFKNQHPIVALEYNGTTLALGLDNSKIEMWEQKLDQWECIQCISSFNSVKLGNPIVEHYAAYPTLQLSTDTLIFRSSKEHCAAQISMYCQNNEGVWEVEQTFNPEFSGTAFREWDSIQLIPLNIRNQLLMTGWSNGQVGIWEKQQNQRWECLQQLNPSSFFSLSTYFAPTCFDIWKNCIVVGYADTVYLWEPAQKSSFCLQWDYVIKECKKHLPNPF